MSCSRACGVGSPRMVADHNAGAGRVPGGAPAAAIGSTAFFRRAGTRLTTKVFILSTIGSSQKWTRAVTGTIIQPVTQSTYIVTITVTTSRYAMIKALPNRIRAFRERAGLSMQALAERAGTSAPQINKLEKGDRKLTVDWMIRLGRALGVDPKDLMVIEPQDSAPFEAGGSGPRKHFDLPASLNAAALEFGQPDLPILGRAQGGSSGVLMIPTEQRAVDWTYRPPHLRGVSDAFAVFAYDDSMHPMYKNGQTLWVHPHLPVKPGDGVLIIKRSDEALIKELVRRTATEVALRQYRPREEEFTLAQDDIRVIYRVVGALDLR
jgi:phage repressor protein C with HTH and peptisase S24 domain